MTEEGGNREGDRIGRCGRSGGGTREHDEHMGKNKPSSNQIYQIQHLLSFTNHLFYRVDEDRRMEMKRCVTRG